MVTLKKPHKEIQKNTVYIYMEKEGNEKTLKNVRIIYIVIYLTIA